MQSALRIFARDLVATERWYTALLGFEPTQDHYGLHYQLDGYTLDLSSSGDKGTFGLLLPSIEQARQRLVQRGLQPAQTLGYVSGSQEGIASFRDPTGNIVVLVDQAAEYAAACSIKPFSGSVPFRMAITITSAARTGLAWLSQRPWAVAVLTLAVVLPALLLHLGWQPLLVDEPIRALVSLEMHYSSQFFAPTLQGLPYYNKPPLFNWLLVGLFRLTGRTDEWVVRLPTVAALLLYGTAIWRVLRPRLGSGTAYAVALAFATTGRVLFYDSFLGLIDLWHAGLTWLAFMAVWHYGQRKQWTRLFAVTYILTAVGFLLKGLPSLVFQGLALSVYCLSTRQVRQLFSWQHALGMGVLLGVVGSYFFLYSRHNSLTTALATLWDQSSQRTVGRRPLGEDVRYMLLFPLGFIGHFLPWTLLTVLLSTRAARRTVWQHPFLRYNALLFGAILPVYWLSPATIPRYLFMLVPLGLTVIVPLYQPAQAAGSAPGRGLDATLLLLLAVASLAPLVAVVQAAAPSLGLPSPAALRGVPATWPLGLGLTLLLSGLTYLFRQLPAYRLPLLGFFLLGLRLSFDAFVFPARLATSANVNWRTAARRIGRETRGRPLVLWPGAQLDHVEAYYIARERGEILTFGTLPAQVGTLYLAEDWRLAGRRYRQLDEFSIENGVVFKLVAF